MIEPVFRITHYYIDTTLEHMLKTMIIKFNFFEKDDLLCSGKLFCNQKKTINEFKSPDCEYVFKIEHEFDYPACPVSIECIYQSKHYYYSALRVGVHNSEDWESVNIGNIHDFVFMCET